MSIANNGEVLHQGYADPTPYPEIKVMTPNKYYASLLMDDYAGSVSELTAINQYLYHYFVTGEEYEAVAKMIERISITEMHHMEILAELIQLLGGDPVYKGNPNTGGTIWTAKYVYYGNDLCSRLYADINSENLAIKNYEEHIHMINDIYVQAILKRIVLDEKIHVVFFQQAIDKYCR